MSINTSIFIRGSVGQGGRNEANDVRSVQKQLNDHAMPPRQKLVVDGKSGPKTAAMIRDFQKAVVGLRNPDGRVDPNGRTLAALNDPASKGTWAQMSIGAPATVPASAAGGTGKGGSLLEQEAARLGMQAQSREILALVNSGLPAAKAVIDTVSTAEHARGLLMLWKNWRPTASGADTFKMIVATQKLNMFKSGPGHSVLEAASRPGSRLGTNLASVSKVAGHVGDAIALYEIADKFYARKFGEGTGETYKLVMGKGLPWTAVIGGLQSLLELVVPASVQNTMLFKILRAIDPGALGGVAVDSGVTVAIGLADMVANGKFQMSQLDQLVARMKASPARFFAELGEEAGDGAHQMSRWRLGDWGYAMTCIPGFLFSLTLPGRILAALGWRR